MSKRTLHFISSFRSLKCLIVVHSLLKHCIIKTIWLLYSNPQVFVYFQYYYLKTIIECNKCLYKYSEAIKVLHIGCNTASCVLPDMSVLALSTALPSGPCVHIRQSTHVCVTTITCIHVLKCTTTHQLAPSSYLNTGQTFSNKFFSKEFHCDFKFIHCYYIAT